MKRIPKKYMFKASRNGGKTRIMSPIGIDLAKKPLEEIKCPCCGEKSLKIGQFGDFGFSDAYKVTCDSCDWDCPTDYNSDCGEVVSELKRWLEAFKLLGRPAEKVNEDLTLYFYPEGEWREKERLERLFNEE